MHTRVRARDCVRRPNPSFNRPRSRVNARGIQYGIYEATSKTFIDVVLLLLLLFRLLRLLLLPRVRPKTRARQSSAGESVIVRAPILVRVRTRSYKCTK
jgi:hypothetical protein